VSTSRRTRLDPESRRQHLLAVGARLFAEHTYDEVWVDEVARQAGVSRGLLYHYFPDKRAFFAAILSAEGKRLAEVTAPDPNLPPLERLRAGLDAYLDYVEQHPDGYRAVHRGALSADPQLRAVVEGNLERQGRRLLDAISPDRDPTDYERLAVHGWLAFLVATALRWLDEQTPDRAQVRDLCVNTLVAAVAAARNS
jgi:AcrR family transcriptional regulator